MRTTSFYHGSRHSRRGNTRLYENDTSQATYVWNTSPRDVDVPRSVVPDGDVSPSFTVGTGDAVYFMHGFRCTWRAFTKAP